LFRDSHLWVVFGGWTGGRDTAKSGAYAAFFYTA